MEGILLVDKPSGWTSHDVVAKVRGILRQAQSQKLKAKSPDNPDKNKLSAFSFQLSVRAAKLRVGHTGTLDPMATGLLILVVGSYTKRAGEFSKLDKSYEAELTLGSISDTGDADGKISRVSDAKPSLTEVEKAILSFVGELSQLPPAYSAVKIKGQRAYKLARTGQAVKLEARAVTIYSIDDIEYYYPKVRFTVSVSSGTYVRSLAADIGAKLATGAYLSSLRRIKVGDYSVDDAKVLTKIIIGDIILPSK